MSSLQLLLLLPVVFVRIGLVGVEYVILAANMAYNIR